MTLFGKESAIDLEKLVNKAYNAMLEHPQKHLLPFYRKAIYDCLKDENKKAGVSKELTWLELITAKKVLPVWQSFYPDDWLAEYLLVLAVAMLNGREIENLDSQIYTASEEFDSRGLTVRYVGVEYQPDNSPFEEGVQYKAMRFGKKANKTDANSFWAGKAIIGAVAKVTANYPIDDFKDYHFIEDYRYEDEEVEDTSLKAANAYAGQFMLKLFAATYLETYTNEKYVKKKPLENTSDTNKRQEFWTWWLKEALPTALEFSDSSSAYYLGLPDFDDPKYSSVKEFLRFDEYEVVYDVFDED